jgi:hypothetical protein
MNTAVIYLKAEFDNDTTIVARITLAMVRDYEGIKDIIKDGEYLVDVNTITRSFNEKTDDYVFTMASKRITINQMAMHYFDSNFKVADVYAWRQMWNSAWMVYAPYEN